MRIRLELSVERPSMSRPRRRRLALAAALAALLLPAVALANHQFTDVPTDHTFHTNIGNLFTAGLTTGCTPTSFCPDANVTRGQMSAFLNRGLGRVAEADINFNGDQFQDGTYEVVGGVALRPGTATSAGQEFIFAQFNGTIEMSAILGDPQCPCNVSVFVGGELDTFSTVAVRAYIPDEGIPVPINAGGVLRVTGTTPEQVDVLVQVVGPGTAPSWTVTGNLFAVTAPFGSNGTNQP
jgi:hypothetical protein